MRSIALTFIFLVAICDKSEAKGLLVIECYSHVLKEKQGLKRVWLNFWEEYRKELEYGHTIS